MTVGAPAAVGALGAPVIAVYAPRERVRAVARRAAPRRHGRLLVARTPDEFSALFRQALVDAALVDIAAPGDDPVRAAALAREFPGVAFFGVTPGRAGDGPAIARSVELGFVDLVVEGMDDPVVRRLIAVHGFSARFAAALREPPAVLGLTRPVQRAAWGCMVARAGRPIRTRELASAIGVSREHLSRSFAAGEAPNLKRVIDLVRLLAAAELAKNPGYAIQDVAHVLGFASSSHLSTAARRVVGTRPGSLAALRAVDLIERFARGRGRSRS